MAKAKYTTKIRDLKPDEKNPPPEICLGDWHQISTGFNSDPMPPGVYRTECPECHQWGNFYIPLPEKRK